MHIHNGAAVCGSMPVSGVVKREIGHETCETDMSVVTLGIFKVIKVLFLRLILLIKNLKINLEEAIEWKYLCCPKLW